MSSKGKKVKSKSSTLSVRDLKTWLDGYCSAHPKDWSPTPEQWTMIRDKIFSLDEEDESPKSVSNNFLLPQQPQLPPRQAPQPVGEFMLPPQGAVMQHNPMAKPHTSLNPDDDKPAAFVSAFA